MMMIMIVVDDDHDDDDDDDGDCSNTRPTTRATADSFILRDGSADGVSTLL
jgi:hypothetical protein